MKNLYKQLSQNYHLILTYGEDNEYTIFDVYKAKKIIDNSYQKITEEDLIEQNLFILDKDYYMAFSGNNSEIIIPIKYVEPIFNSDKTITRDTLAFYVINKLILEDDKKLSDYFKNNYIKLDSLNAEYTYKGRLNNNNYEIVAVRLGKPYLLTDELVNKSHEKLKVYKKTMY